MEAIIKALGWPHVTLLFAIIFVFLFKKPLFGLISRITSIDKSGIKALQTPEVQREEQKKESVQQLLLAIGDSIVLRDIEGRIKADLQERGLETEGDTIKILIKHLAGTRVLLEFEQIHNLIFGSQIFLLKKLNEVAGQGKTIDFIVAHFKNVKSLFPEQLGGWTLEQYLAFLKGRILITIQGNIFHITNLGVEYLTWMARNGREENRPL
jgi:hypothetical protein